MVGVRIGAAVRVGDTVRVRVKVGVRVRVRVRVGERQSGRETNLRARLNELLHGSGRTICGAKIRQRQRQRQRL